MSFNTTEIAKLGKAGLDLFLKNKPVDQIATARPLMKMIMAKKSFFRGGVQYVVEQLRKSYSANGQWYHGADAVTYNSKDTLEQANFTWGSRHDGFYFTEDELLSNGIVINDNLKNAAEKNETVQLTQMFDEAIETLTLGFQEELDYEMHLDGTQDAEAVAGLDHLVSLDGVGTVGGINATTFDYWKNYFITSGVIVTNIIETMEVKWRECSRAGGKAPTHILVGSKFLDMFRTAAKGDIARYTILRTAGEAATLDPSITDLHFHGVPLMWDPIFETLDDNLSPTIEWEKRCYFLNMANIKYRPVKGHDMQTRMPPREHDRYVWYWALTHKYALTTNKRNVNAVIAID